MSSSFKYENKEYLLPSDCNLSVGNTCDTREHRMSDGSGTSYSIATYAKPQVNTYSLSFVLTSSEYPNMFDELYKWENLVGKVVDFTYCNIPFKSVIIADMNVAFGLDSTVGLTSLSLSFNLRDNVVLTRKAEKINVRFS